MANYTARATRALFAVAAAELPLYLIEINHEALVDPVRIVQDNRELIHQGNTYLPLEFRLQPPDDMSKGLPRAKISIDNVARDLVSLLEITNGARGSTCSIRQVLRSTPNTVESVTTLSLFDIEIDLREVTGSLSYKDFVNLQGVVKRYDPQTAPGLFG
jgi:Domain of unknown function (DUF1833)